MKTDSCCISTPLGTAEISGTGEGVERIHITDHGGRLSENIPTSLCQAVIELREYFDGARKSFTFPLNPVGSAFQKSVWLELSKIPFGTTVSYSRLATAVGNPKAVRAVASANAKNPLWIVIPCHRVIGNGGSLTGYAGGIWRKKWLLEHEGALAQTTLVI